MSSQGLNTTNTPFVRARRSARLERQVGAPPALRAADSRIRQPPRFQPAGTALLAGKPRNRRRPQQPQPGPHVERPGRLRGGGGSRVAKQAQNGADQGRNRSSLPRVIVPTSDFFGIFPT